MGIWVFDRCGVGYVKDKRLHCSGMLWRSSKLTEGYPCSGLCRLKFLRLSCSDFLSDMINRSLLSFYRAF